MNKNWWFEQVKFSFAMSILVTAALMTVITTSVETFVASFVGIFVYRIVSHFGVKYFKNTPRL